MKAKSPLDGNTYYFVNKSLPFGASISCSHFQRVSNAIAHIVKFRSKEDLINYLDDFYFAALFKWYCDRQVKIFLDTCGEINFPVAMEKTVWGTIRLVFLGLLINMDTLTVSIPEEKIIKALGLINDVLTPNSKGVRKTTLKKLQQLCGYLNFLSHCILPGRAFTWQLYAYASNKLLPHHHIRVNQEMRADLTTWLTFLNKPEAYSREFMDFDKLWHAYEIMMYSDATKQAKLGFRGYCDSDWTYSKWEKNFIEQEDPSIQYLKLFAVTVVVKVWIKRFKNRRIVLFCDNESVVNMLNNTSCSCKNCMVLMRMIVLECMIWNVRVFAKHVNSKSNLVVDLLSRLKIQTPHR